MDDYYELLRKWGLNVDIDKNEKHFFQIVSNRCHAYKKSKIALPEIYQVCNKIGLPLPRLYFDYESFNYISFGESFDFLNSNSSSSKELLVFLIILGNSLVYDEVQEDYIKIILSAKKLSKYNIEVIYTSTDAGTEFAILPQNAPILDRVIVDDLGILSNYPKAFEQYKKALQYYLNDDSPRTIADELRLSFEILVKDMLNTKKTLENSIGIIGEYLDKCGIDVSIRNSVITLIRFFAQYHNDNSKHANETKKIEVEYILYQTSVFMRLLLTCKEQYIE